MPLTAEQRELIVVTSAGGANGPGHDAMLAFDLNGELLGLFSDDPRISDPRGLSPDPSGALIYVNSADRILALDRRGRVVRDSGPRTELDPGGAVFGPDGRFYATLRQRRTILALSPMLDGAAEPLLPDGIVPFPRGFAFGHDGDLYLASGIGPSGEGDNLILVFAPDAPARPRPLVIDPELSPLDLAIAPNGHLVVASEAPFGTPDAIVTVREYDPSSGDLVRIFVADPSLRFRQPRGLRFGSDGRLYCVGAAHVIAFDFSTGCFLGDIVRLPKLHGQALVLLDQRCIGSVLPTPPV